MRSDKQGVYYPAYIFDLYGTLVDIRTKEDSPALWKKVSLWYKEHGAGWQDKELHRRYLELCRSEQQSYPDPLAEIELRNIFTSLYKEKGIHPAKELIEETACFFRICSVKKLRLYPWVLPVFEKLKERGSSLYLLSNAQACFTQKELLGLGLLDAFNGIVISSDIGIKKPSPKILQHLMDRYHLKAADCLMVGNDPDADIKMASDAGIDTLYIITESSPRGAYPEYATRILADENYQRMNELLKR